MDLVFSGEHLLADKYAEDDGKTSQSGVEDPCIAQTLGVSGGDYPSLVAGQGRDDIERPGCGAVDDLFCRVGRESGSDHACVRGDAVLEDDAAENDGHGRGDITGEEEGRRGTRDVRWLCQAENSDDWSLEHGANSYPGYDLENNDARP